MNRLHVSVVTLVHLGYIVNNENEYIRKYYVKNNRCESLDDLKTCTISFLDDLLDAAQLKLLILEMRERACSTEAQSFPHS